MLKDILAIAVIAIGILPVARCDEAGDDQAVKSLGGRIARIKGKATLIDFNGSWLATTR